MTNQVTTLGTGGTAPQSLLFGLGGAYPYSFTLTTSGDIHEGDISGTTLVVRVTPGGPITSFLGYHLPSLFDNLYCASILAQWARDIQGMRGNPQLTSALGFMGYLDTLSNEVQNGVPYAARDIINFSADLLEMSITLRPLLTHEQLASYWRPQGPIPVCIDQAFVGDFSDNSLVPSLTSYICRRTPETFSFIVELADTSGTISALGGLGLDPFFASAPSTDLDLAPFFQATPAVDTLTDLGSFLRADMGFATSAILGASGDTAVPIIAGTAVVGIFDDATVTGDEREGPTWWAKEEDGYVIGRFIEITGKGTFRIAAIRPRDDGLILECRLDKQS